MDCPFCGKEMREGTIPSGLKWVEDGALDAWEGVRLSIGPFGKTPKSFFCPDCRQIILPVQESESVMDIIDRKLEAAGEKIEAAQKQWEAQRARKKEETKKKKFRDKDPWEL